jgi:hypothetical protein
MARLFSTTDVEDEDLQRAIPQYNPTDQSYGDMVSEGLGLGFSRALSSPVKALSNILPEIPGLSTLMSYSTPALLSKTSQGQQVMQDIASYGQTPRGETLFNMATATELAPMMRGVGLATSPAMRGSALTGGDVFKRGHYNPEQIEVGMYNRDSKTGVQDLESPRSSADSLGMLSRVSRPVEQFALNVLKPTEQALNKYKTAKGHAKFFLSGAGGIIQNMFSPESRALYADYGISRSMDRAYGRYQKAVESNDPVAARQALIEAHQQAQQTGVIRKQVGAEAKKTDWTESFLEAASDPNSPAPPTFKVSDYGDNWYHELASPAATFGDFPVEKSNFIQNHIEKVWGGLRGYDRTRTQASIKTPRSDITGNHFTDVMAENPSVRTKIANVFLGGSEGAPELRQFNSVEELKAALEPLTRNNKYVKGEKAGQVKKDKFGKDELPSIRIQGQDSDGVWVSIPGLVGKSGKVEGGINALVHVKTNGELIGVMSDMHNFLEEIPIPKVGRIRNRPMEAAVKDDYLNMTPPMQTNVVSISKEGKFGDAAEELREAARETMPVPARAQSNKDNPAAQKRLEETMSQQVSGTSYARESVPVAQNAFLVGNAFGEDEVQSLEPDDELMGTRPLFP